MAQFGAATSITVGIRLILLDCFETLVEIEGGGYRARRGIVEFLEHFRARRDMAMAVVSDAEKALVDAALAQAGLATYFPSVYHAGNALEDIGQGRVRKRLDVPLGDFAVRPEQAMFIGDSPLDAEAARHHRVNFIRVPRSEDRDFSFATLIAGPSRYNSAEFSATLLDRYISDHARKDGRK